ncbi:integrase, catalytic region, zinc finger, CCHC-type containing protein [Tanacetum coccineum]
MSSRSRLFLKLMQARYAVLDPPNMSTVKYPKGIAKNVLVGIGKFVFPVDFIILDMPEDVKVPLILGRPFLSTAHAKIDVFKIKITLRFGEEKIIFKSVKPASSLIKRVYMLSLRERMELDLKARLMGETLVLNRSLDPFFEDYIELNDLNVPLELRRDQVDDLMPTIEEGEVVEEFRARNDVRMVSKFFGYPSECDHNKKIRIDCAHNLMFSCMIDFAVLEDMDAYRDEGMGDVIFGEPLLREVGIYAKRFEGMITIYNGNEKNTLAEYMILFGADNRPPMLDKDLYDSWKSKIELYMQNRESRRMILESIENGPLIWPTIEENGVIRPKKYAELSATEKIQANCDLKVTNIILQGLPADIYSLVNHHRVAKDLWEIVQLLMQGTALTKQERECKLYNAFDKFAHIKGESLHKYYLRFTQLINEMNIYKMKLKQFQVNTKFLNSLPPKWSKFVTDVKLVKDLHTTNFDQLHAYLEQHELHANEVCIMRERNPDPLALVANHQACLQPPFVPQIQYTVSTVSQQTHMAEFPQIDYGLAVPVFKQGDDPIDAINKMMSFLSTVVTSRFPSTNNQLRNSSNPRQQATIHDGRETVQPLYGRQNSYATGTSGTRANTSGT